MQIAGITARLLLSGYRYFIEMELNNQLERSRLWLRHGVVLAARCWETIFGVVIVNGNQASAP